jgi:hypothetical protein
MKEIEILRLNGKKGFDESKIKRKFVTVKARKKKISSSLRKDLYRNYGFKLEDN